MTPEFAVAREGLNPVAIMFNPDTVLVSSSQRQSGLDQETNHQGDKAK